VFQEEKVMGTHFFGVQHIHCNTMAGCPVNTICWLCELPVRKKNIKKITGES